MKRKLHNTKARLRKRRAFSIRKKIEGTAQRPRLSVYRSARHIYCQLVDDIAGRTLASASTVTKDLRGEVASTKKKDIAEKVGTAIAEKAKAVGVETVVFDRNGFPYHGRVAALAKGARDAGLKF